jgi:Holliday junction resolvase RusA-like endonuclease
LSAIEFFAAGQPQTKGSARAFVVKGRAVVTNDNKKAAAWQGVVSCAARDAGVRLLEGPVAVEAVFLLPRPQGHYRSGKNAHLLREDAPERPAKKPDVDKLARVVLDALTGLAYVDDAQVVSVSASKRWAQRGGLVGASVSVKPVSMVLDPIARAAGSTT